MKILFLSQLLPLPLDAGPKVRAYYVLRHLVAAGHEVTLLCFARPDDREPDVERLRRLCAAVATVPLHRSRARDVRDLARSVFSKVPFLILRDRVPAMADAATRAAVARSFDAVHADQLWMAAYAAALPAVPLRVLDQHNAVFRVPERLAGHQPNLVLGALLRLEAKKLAAYERGALDGFTRVVWVSAADRDACRAGGGGSDAIIPIAVDPAALAPVERPRPFRVTFVGGLHWPPNAEGARWFAERVWPAVSRAVPGAVFTVIGRAGRKPPRRLEGTRRIEVTGYVPDPTPYLSETAAFVVPLLSGAGMRVKILDAWSRRLPVVSTTMGAEGLRWADGENLLIGDTPEAFAAALVHVLGDRRLADRLAANGRATVESSYDWRSVYRAWDPVYQ